MLYEKFIKDLGFVGFVTFLRVLRGIILLPIITKLLGPEQYGTWTQLMVTLGLVTPLILLGLPNALLRYTAAEKNKAEMQNGVFSVLTVVFGLSLLSTAGFILFAHPIASFFQASPMLIYLLSLLVIFEVLSTVFFFVLRALQEIGKYSVFTIIQTFGEIALAILLLFLGYELLGAIVAFLAIRVVGFVILLILIIRRIGFRIPTFSPIRSYLSYGLPLFISNISYWMVTSSDRYLIGFFLGILFVGYYAPAYAIGSILSVFVAPFAMVLSGTLSKLYDEKEIPRVQALLKYSLTYFLFLAIPTAFALSILSKPLLTLFSTQEIASNSFFVTPFILLSTLLYGVHIILSQSLQLTKKTRHLGTMWFAAALLNIGLNIYFIPIFGILGAAITTLVVYTLTTFLTHYYAARYLPVLVDWIAITKSLVASTLMALFYSVLSPFLAHSSSCHHHWSRIAIRYPYDSPESSAARRTKIS